MTTPSFLWEDYVVFFVMLLISAGIGLFFAIYAKRRNRASADDMLTGGHSLHWLPVAFSLGASFTSATTILGVPAEVYTRGGEQFLWMIGIIPCFLIIAIFIVPVFHRLQLTCAYEYLEIRFNKTIRYIGSFSFCIIILLYMAAVLYAPAIALRQVTGIPKAVSIVIMGLVCTFYTCIGGIRAVVWADAFQLFVIWGGLIVLMIQGALKAGGWDKVWELAREGDRLPRFEMNPDPTIRHTFWTFLLGGGTNMMCVYGGYQINLQRYSSVKSLRAAQGALLLNLPLWMMYITLLCLLGLVMYAVNECDPLSNKDVTRPDQLLPLLVLDTFGDKPGLPGLFVASIFSASISTLSSGINSMAAVTLEDLFKPLYNRYKGKSPAPKMLTIVTMSLVFMFGMLTIGTAYVIGNLGKTAFMISFSVFGMIGGPLLGLVLNGIFCPYVNSKGAGAGFFLALLGTFYYGIYPIVNPPPKIDLPPRLDSCDPMMNFTTMASPMRLGQDTSLGHPYVSYLHLSTVALILSFIGAAVFSLATGCNKDRELDERTYYHYSWCRKSRRSNTITLEDKNSISHTNTKAAGTYRFSPNGSCAIPNEDEEQGQGQNYG